MKDIHQVTEEVYVAEAKLKATIAQLGDKLAKKQGYKNLQGMDAIYRCLIDKYHWLPDHVRSLSVSDLQLLLDGVL
jgi:molybdopterin converting factor small subunit